MAKQKKEKTEIKLPKAWTSMKHRNETAQARTDYTDLWKAIGVILIIVLILFIFLGGINQRKTIQWFKDFGANIGNTISKWFNPDKVEVNGDGIYYRPDGIPTDTDSEGSVYESYEDGSTSYLTEASEASNVEEPTESKAETEVATEQTEANAETESAT